MRCVLNIQGERASLLSMRRISLILAGASLVWERAVPLVWPVLAWLFLYAGITLLGAWDAVGDPWRALFALVSLTGFAVLTWQAARQFAWAKEGERPNAKLGKGRLGKKANKNKCCQKNGYLTHPCCPVLSR